MNDALRDTATPVETEGEDVLSAGFRRMVRHAIRYVQSDGRWSEMQTRDLHEGNGVAAIIAYDLSRDELVLIRQFRLAAHLVTGNGVMVEIVAGGVEGAEDPEAAAQRELAEETGLEAQKIVHCFDFMPSPGITSEFASLFLASVDASHLPARAGEDEDEDVVPFSIGYDEALALARGGTVMNGFLLLALNWLVAKGKPAVRNLLQGDG